MEKGSTGPDSIQPPGTKLTYAVTAQHAYHTTDQSEPLGAMDLSAALDAFDKFDWMGEAEQADQLKRRAPTLAFEDDATGRLLWVSGYVPGGKLYFVSECRFPGEVRKFFGLRRTKGFVDLSTGGFLPEQARKAIELFYADAREELEELFRESWAGSADGIAR